MIDKNPEDNYLEFGKLSRSQKRQVVIFIRKHHPVYVNIREIVRGVYFAIERKGFLVGVGLDMEKAYENK